MSGDAIAREVDAALREVARDVGDGEFVVTLQTPTGTPANPWDAPTGAPVSTELPALVQVYPQSMIDGKLIQQGDRRVMVSALGPKPTTADRLVIQSVTHRIISVEETGPSGVALFYEVQARV
jgi:hypothetical protein